MPGSPPVAFMRFGLKQIAVCTCSGKRQNQKIVINPVYQKPVRGNMTLSMPNPIAG